MRAFTLMTAMPPTKGHHHLMEFVSTLGDEQPCVIVTTQPHEPFVKERINAVRSAGVQLGLRVNWLNEELPQDPASVGFWKMWKKLMTERFDFKPGDIFVSSELYGAKLAEVCDGVFMPYDPKRELHNVKATRIRMDENGLWKNFSDIMVEFQHNLRPTITVFGAESTGKTTVSKELANLTDSHWLYEWARPYLETVGKEITVEKMHTIWHGQAAAQRHTLYWPDKPFLVQDTDLYSTIGYWEQPHWKDTLGEVPDGLITEAAELKSDLYIILKAQIPFEPDDIRYGDGKQESPDEFWIGIADKYNLNYHVIDSGDWSMRIGSGLWAMRGEMEKKQEAITYDREGF